MPFQVPSRPADRFLAPDAGVVVGDSLALALAAFAYDGPLRRALAALKYSGASRLAPILARAAEPALLRLLAVTGPAMLVPVPLHRRAAAGRGYNQACCWPGSLRAGADGARRLDALVRARPDDEAAPAQPGSAAA